MKTFFTGLVLGLMLLGGFSIFNTPQAVFGAFSPTGGGTYRLGQSVGTSDTSIKLSSFKEPVSNISYTMSYLNSDILYGTLSPQSSISEFISATGITQNSDGSATLTGITRGLTRTPAGSNCVASTTLAQPHAGQSIFILSNSPCFYAEYLTARTNATSSAVLTFGSTTPPRYDVVGTQAIGTPIATTSEFASVAYVNAISIAGVNNATQGIKGIVQLATARQEASSTSLGSTAASNVLQAGHATDTPTTQGCSLTGGLSGGCIAMSALDGFLRQTWFDLTKQWTFTSLFATNASSTNATTTSFGLPSITSTILKTSSTGVVQPAVSGTDYQKEQYVAASNTDFIVNNTTSTTTMMTIPANTLTASSSITLSGILGITGAQTCTIRLRDVTGATMAVSQIVTAGNNTAQFQIDVYSQSSLTSQIGRGMLTSKDDSGVSEQTSAINFASALVLNLVMTSSAANNCNINGWFITVTP